MILALIQYPPLRYKVIPREGVESQLTFGWINSNLTSAPVIPREGVESVIIELKLLRFELFHSDPERGS